MPGHTSPSSQPTPKPGSTSMEYFRKAGTRSDWEPATRRILRSAVPGKELAETTIRLSGRSRKYACTIEFFQPMKFGRPTRSQPNSEQSELPRGPTHVSGAFYKRQSQRICHSAGAAEIGGAHSQGWITGTV